MSDFLDRISQYSPKRLALLADDLRSRLETLEARSVEPIAIVGIGCRLPGGADTPEKFWDLLTAARDAIVEVPDDRWSLEDLYDPSPEAPGRMSTRWGGFLERVDRFDPHFFGISPREAHRMDPQQRLVLEVAWEALEQAGIPPHTVEDTRTGVYLGLSASDYYQIIRADGIERFDAYTASGVAHSIASGRLSYVLGARGPSVSIDTACSSSLVAIHMAVHGLRRGECTMALAGGVNLMLTPDTTIALSKSGMMAPDGRCKVFDARADGFVRGEGCGMLVLKTLSRAQADGDDIIALIRGSASNQDGRSNGLTAPNGPSQQQVIADALADARVSAADVSVIEAHGTGTALGDPIEVQALAAAYGRERSAPLLIGSVKANFGHLESAAGVTSVIKMALALRHGRFPRQLHFDTPNPHIAWDSLPVRVAATETPLPSERRLGGVSSFGFSGTNVHMILEQPPDPRGGASAALSERPVHLLALSARDQTALRAVAEARRREIASAPDALADIAWSANTGRTHFAQRLALAAADAADAMSQLDAFIAGTATPGPMTGRAPSRTPKIAFLFTGQGAQYAGMGRALYETQPVFRSAMERCDGILSRSMPKRLLSIIYPGPGDAGMIDATEYTQPALFALEYALAELWASWGVRPSMVLGHSVGEYVAACVAGVLTLEDALTLIAARGRLMGSLPRDGAMAAVMADRDQVARALEPFGSEVAIAAVNGPRNVVISGRERAVVSLVARFESQGISATRLNVSHAFHSPAMAPIAAEFTRVAETLRFSPPSIEVVTNLTGTVAGTHAFQAEYWREQLLSPVLFAQGIETLLAAGCTAFVEIGPAPTLIGMARQCAPEANAAWIASLRRGREDSRQLLEGVGALYVAGGEVDWKGFDSPWARRRRTLATYPFQRERYWVDPAEPVVALDRAGSSHDRIPARIRSMLYEATWIPGTSSSASLAPVAEVGRDVDQRFDELVRLNGLDAYGRFATGLDELVSRYIVRALQELGFPLSREAMFDSEALRRQLGVTGGHGRLFERLLQILAEDGILAQHEGRWRVENDAASADAQALADTLRATHPDCAAELTLTCRCGQSLAAVLRGDDPLPLLFPEGSLADTENLYQASPPARAYNTAMAAALERALRDRPSSRSLRVLEIGAGTGSTTSYLLPVLARFGDALEYAFTDVSAVFLQRARRKFADVAGLRFATLDVTTDPLAQGFDGGAYDVVIAANVLHATPDLAVTMRNVRRLMRTGGLLMLLEGSTRQRFGDVTVGMLDGWWAFTDKERRDYALMSKAGWCRLLDEQGFDATLAVPGSGEHPVLAQQAIVLAQASRVEAPSSRWLIVPDRIGIARQVAERLTALGHVARVAPSADSLAPWFSEAFQEPWDGVLHLAGIDVPLDDTLPVELLEAAQQRSLGSALTTAQFLASRTDAAAGLWIVTRGAQATSVTEQPDPAQATLWGFSHTVALEHPELQCRRLDLDPQATIAAASEALVRELTSPESDEQVALRDTQRLVRRISAFSPPPRMTTSPRFDPDRSYLVTGGLRGLGLRVAEWLVEQGVRNLALMGRRDGDERSQAVLQRLRDAGVEVLTLRGDVGVEADVRRVLDQIATALPPLAGIVHSAGALADGVLTKQTWPSFATVFGPKVSGSWLLHTLAPRLDFLVLFSSGASLAGSGGQANHSAANAFEDALAWHRQARGLATVSINWGPWAEIGAAAERKLGTPGSLRPISPADGLTALAYALRRDPQTRLFHTAQLGVLDADWASLSRTSADAALFAEPAGGARTAASPIDEVPLHESIRSAPAARRRNILREHVRRHTAQVLGVARAEDIDVNEPFGQLGLDSLMAVELRNRLAKASGRSFPATLTLDHPSVEALTDHLAREAFAEEMDEGEGQHGDLDDLSADELAQQLLQRLESLG